MLRVVLASVLSCAFLVLSHAPASAASSAKKVASKRIKGKKATMVGKNKAARAATTSLSRTRARPVRGLRARANGIEIEASESSMVALSATWKKSGAGDPRGFGRMEVVIADAGKNARGNRNTGSDRAAVSIALRSLTTRHRQFTGGTGQSANSIVYGFRARRVSSKVDRDDTTLEIAQKLADTVNALRRADGVPYYDAQAKVSGGKVTLTIWPGGAFE
jgi:hypothetical protein